MDKQPSSLRRSAATGIVALAVTVAGLSAATPLDPAPAIISRFDATTETLRFRTLGPDGTPSRDTSWRVVSGTGNCCENYLATTPSGRLLDMGGDWLRYSDDAGVSWMQVSTETQIGLRPGVAGEGAVVPAPNGDIVAVTWFPYDGDRLLATRYDASRDVWEWKDVVLRTPFYDRPWIAIVPGPLVHHGVEVPYLVMLKGAWPFKQPWFVSGDGLDYEPVDPTLSTLTGPVRAWLDGTGDPSVDFTQPIAAAESLPLPGRDALLRSGAVIDTCGGAPLISSVSDGWRCFLLPNDDRLPLNTRIGSAGTIHQLDVFPSAINYRLSRDGGRSWADAAFPLPPGLRAESTAPERGDHDFKVNDARRIGVLGLKTRAEDNTLQVLVLVFSTKGSAPALLRTVLLGKGDVAFASSLDTDSERPRMDFMTVAILPDGAVAASFGDSDHLEPAIAIEQR